MGTCLNSPIGTQYEAAVVFLGLQIPSNNWGQINIVYQLQARNEIKKIIIALWTIFPQVMK